MKHSINFVCPAPKLSLAPADGLPEICISGRSNVGKSSLLNQLAGGQQIARVSQVPGKTRALNYYSLDKCGYLVDLPGYGYAKASLSIRDQFARLVDSYLDTRKTLVGMIQLFDARHGPVSGDLEMIEWLRSWHGQVLYVFTKADKLTAQSQYNVKQHYYKEFGVENVTLFSARTGAGLDSIWSWIHKTLDSCPRG